MFCDQDDVWLSNKIKVTLDCMKKNKKVKKPIAVFTDLCVVDESNI